MPYRDRELPVSLSPRKMTDADHDVFLHLPQLLERMQRRYLDVLRFELTRLGVDDINASQAMQLLHVDGDITVQDFVDRSGLAGSKAFYNIRKLIEAGYLDESRAPTDRRVVRVRLSGKAKTLCSRLRAAHNQLAGTFMRDKGAQAALEEAHRALRVIEHSWEDRLRLLSR